MKEIIEKHLRWRDKLAEMLNSEKNIEKVSKNLHPDIQFTDPQETVIGREVVLKAARGFTGIFKTLTIRAPLVQKIKL